ncbi:CDP-diacylglycerol--glycerol-3-phosphate 3-phosphatidyltransferase [Bacteriovorax sp. BSW11_IV]|uniref:CDP-diacylglycerol--glycerol-3-phosphate 3-phosphatidyltransferase n=1 Tax=Bacteriovorax sp. BSW11_IV TaxID=1353529 RepID=UPI00038A4084|nr:CDP-diacylglycerol--glycerol-3-phosphate 3-phosphatidyltransferase [Bacteriovorax sp. BSW11_IV]EQC46385.1 CDP-diacylglycerol--glycerol-3-phosphate 3-phosphatidyltransferase [Bacteriovorax sp. BSW11_IV]
MSTNDHEWEIDNLPNRLTIFRMILIPIIIGALFICSTDLLVPYHKTLGYVAAWTFVVASITDFFDGYIARKRKIVTVFGSFLDPIADKFLVVSSLILLEALGRVHSIIVVILVLREMYITSLRLLATERGLSVPVGSLGKWKTTFQMLAIPFLMANDHPFGIPMPIIGTIFIFLASFFSLYSALEYSSSTIKKLASARKQTKLAKKEKVAAKVMESEQNDE